MKVGDVFTISSDSLRWVGIVTSVPDDSGFFTSIDTCINLRTGKLHSVYPNNTYQLSEESKVGPRVWLGPIDPDAPPVQADETPLEVYDAL